MKQQKDYGKNFYFSSKGRRLAVMASIVRHSTAGPAKYYSGVPCEFGHIGERMTNSGVCCVCLASGRDPTAAVKFDDYITDQNVALRKREKRKHWLDLEEAKELRRVTKEYYE